MLIEPYRYTVSELTELISELLTSIPEFQDIWVEGEISNFRRPSSGHLYFTLKDASAQIACVMFRSRAMYLRFQPNDGDQVRVRGSIAVYKRGGQYQINVARIEAAGAGVLQQALERLRRRLEAEGLFDEAHKKSLPRYPKRIGVVTSATGAAIRDIVSILQRRFPYVDVLLYPVLVQGEEAASQIAQAIRDFNRWNNVDVLIVGRGGGSIEDLWAFNEEIVVRAIFASHIPVVSAVGHEIDVTLADLVADRRAATPSAAAELVVPDRGDVLRHLEDRRQRLLTQITRHVERARSRWLRLHQRLDPHRRLDAVQQMQQHLDMLTGRATRAVQRCIERSRQRHQLISRGLIHLSPRVRLQDSHKQVMRLQERLVMLMTQHLVEARSRMEKFTLRLEALNPYQILERGYSICLDAEGKPILRADQVQPGDHVQVQLAQGQLQCQVLRTQP